MKQRIGKAEGHTGIPFCKKTGILINSLETGTLDGS